MKVWRTLGGDASAAARIAAECGLPPVVAGILAGRGFGDPAAVGRFLHPRLADLGDPFALPDMAPAVRRIWRAIEAGEPVAIFGDYDVDGLVSAGLLTQVLTRLGAGRVSVWLPSRQAEGYGFSPAALQRCLDGGRPGLILTADCGTNDREAVGHANALGIEVVVTDHHACSETPAPAHAVVNPRRTPDSDQALLAGVGVAFKLCHALVKDGRDRGLPRARTLDLRDYLDRVAVGTVADVVPLIGENRTLVQHGLRLLNGQRALCWQVLADVAGIVGPLDARHIGFRLGPRLNAAGRMGSPDPALELLLTTDRARARELAEGLEKANRERRQVESALLAEAVRELEPRFDPEADFGLVVARDDWHPGVIGIVAARLAARFRRPTAVVAFDRGGVGRGSCRSIEGFHLLEALAACRGHIEAFGGHAMAAGLSVARAKVDGFRAAFNAAARRALAGRDLRPVQPVDVWTTLGQIDNRLADALEILQPFGLQNPEPILAARSVRLAGPARRVGMKHLRFAIADGGARREAVAFHTDETALPQGPMDVAFTLQRNAFSGGAVELNVQAVRPAGVE